jgi:glyceraldehyde 3-phosphate dehydrogenase
MTHVAINGLGRIGRATMKIILEDSRFNLVAVNDILSTANLAYLLKYDTVYGRWGGKRHGRRHGIADREW